MEARAEVGAVLAGLGADETGEDFGFGEDERVFREKAEEDAHEKAFQVVRREAAGLERVVQFAHTGVGFFVGGVLGIEAHARLPEHEGKLADVLRELGQREVMRVVPLPGKERQVTLFVRLQIVQDEAGKIRDEDEARDLVGAVGASEVADVIERLGLRRAEVFAEALVLDEQFAFPEQVDGTRVALEVADVFLERCQQRAPEAEDLEKIVPEGLLLRAFGAGAGMHRVTREADGAVADFVPGKMRHGCSGA